MPISLTAKPMADRISAVARDTCQNDTFRFAFMKSRISSARFSTAATGSARTRAVPPTIL